MPGDERDRFRPVGVALAAGLWLWAGGVRADGSAMPVAELNAVAVTGRLFGETASASAGTVYSEQFQFRPLARPAELLEVVPGLVATQHSGEGKANQYFLRGFNLDHGTDFAFSVDDVPVNLPSHAHGQGYADLNFMIPELVDRIDYRKGPYYAQYGDFATAGAADIRYKDTLEQPFVQAAGGSSGYARLVAAGASPAAGGRLLYGVEGLHYDGPFDRAGNFNKGSGVLRFSAADAGKSYYVEAMAYQAHWDASDQVPRRAVQQGLISAYGCIDCSDAGSTYRYSLAGGFSRSLGSGTLSAAAYAVRYHLNLYSDFTYYLHQDNAAALGIRLDPARPSDQIEQLDTRGVYGGRLAWRQPLRLGGLAASYEAGLQLRDDAVSPSSLYDTQDRARRYTVVDDRVDEFAAAPYLQTAVRWNRWLRSEAGLRYDFVHAGVSANIAGNGGGATRALASPKLSLVAGPFARTELFLNLGRGFHSNDARGATETLTPRSLEQPQAGARAQPAALLAAARGADLGLRSAWLPHAELALSWFVLDLDSELTLDGDNGTTGVGGATRRQGLEASLLWRPLRHVVVDADYAYSHARYRQPLSVAGPAYQANAGGDHVAESPTSVAGLGLTYQSPAGWDAAVRLRYFAPRPLVEDNSVASSATRLVNASLGWNPAPRLRLSLQGTNLLDSRDHDIDYFYASRLRNEPAGGVNDIHFHPVDPIAGRVLLCYSY
ncbi:MAG: TonB-dependent receptor [Nevskia sp.]|nr:TonB-dependent receptor [Nevskia sp.]